MSVLRGPGFQTYHRVCCDCHAAFGARSPLALRCPSCGDLHFRAKRAEYRRRYTQTPHGRAAGKAAKKRYTQKMRDALRATRAAATGQQEAAPGYPPSAPTP